MDFYFTEEYRHLQQICQRLAQDFATRAAEHDREATHPVENYAALRREGFYGLNIPKELGGWGIGLLGYSLAAEELAQGCPATALSFNMHLSLVGPFIEDPEFSPATKRRIADLVIKEQKLISGSFSEPTTSALLASYAPATRARRVEGGYLINGRKAFASMLEAADYCAIVARPEEATTPAAAVILLIPRQTPGQRVEHVWDTLGMRATRSDFLILENCLVPEEAALFETEDIFPFSLGMLELGLNPQEMLPPLKQG